MKKFIELKSHLADNTGDENVSKLIWIVIVFVVGALMLTLLSDAFKTNGAIKDYLDKSFAKWFIPDGDGRTPIV